MNVSSRLSGKEYSNFDHSKLLPRHRWYYFKEGFSPLMVEEAIRSANLENNDIVLDPFVGSGTVSLVSSARNYKSIGVEVNPFMAFVANTKMSKVKANDFDKFIDVVTDGVNRGATSSLEGYSTFTNHSDAAKWLFNTDVLRAFEGGWQASENVPREIKKIFRLGLLSSVMDNCNAKKDGKCLRYKKDWDEIPYTQTTFENNFTDQIKLMRDDLENFRVNRKGKIIFGDARKKLNKAVDSKFKLCITSPPYLNSFDYSDIYRPELFLGKFINCQKELTKLRLKTLRSHVQAKWRQPTKSDFGFLYQNCIAEVQKREELLWNKRIPTMIQAYFEDMDNLLRQLKNKAKKEASLWIVVSTSAYAGVEIPVDLILADIGSAIGWRLEEVVVTRHLRNSTQNANRWKNGEATSKRLRESIVIFKGID